MQLAMVDDGAIQSRHHLHIYTSGLYQSAFCTLLLVIRIEAWLEGTSLIGRQSGSIILRADTALHSVDSPPPSRLSSQSRALG